MKRIHFRLLTIYLLYPLCSPDQFLTQIIEEFQYSCPYSNPPNNICGIVCATWMVEFAQLFCCCCCCCCGHRSCGCHRRRRWMHMSLSYFQLKGGFLTSNAILKWEVNSWKNRLSLAKNYSTTHFQFTRTVKVKDFVLLFYSTRVGKEREREVMPA